MTGDAAGAAQPGLIQGSRRKLPTIPLPREATLDTRGISRIALNSPVMHVRSFSQNEDDPTSTQDLESSPDRSSTRPTHALTDMVAPILPAEESDDGSISIAASSRLASRMPSIDFVGSLFRPRPRPSILGKPQAPINPQRSHNAFELSPFDSPSPSSSPSLDPARHLINSSNGHQPTSRASPKTPGSPNSHPVSLEPFTTSAGRIPFNEASETAPLDTPLVADMVNIYRDLPLPPGPFQQVFEERKPEDFDHVALEKHGHLRRQSGSAKSFTVKNRARPKQRLFASKHEAISANAEDNPNSNKGVLPKYAKCVVPSFSFSWKKCSFWKILVYVLTFWLVPPMLSLLGKHDHVTRYAFREKVALCMLILGVCFSVAFLTYGLPHILCTRNDGFQVLEKELRFRNATAQDPAEYVWMFGKAYYKYEVAGLTGIYGLREKEDLSWLFLPSVDSPCYRFSLNVPNLCMKEEMNSLFPGGGVKCLSRSYLSLLTPRKTVAYDWEDLQYYREETTNLPALFVLNGLVLNFNLYKMLNLTQFLGTGIEEIILSNLGRDATLGFVRKNVYEHHARCLIDLLTVGRVSRITPGCFTTKFVMLLCLIVIIAVVFARFFLALLFDWFVAVTLLKNPRKPKYPLRQTRILQSAVLDDPYPENLPSFFPSKEARLPLIDDDQSASACAAQSLNTWRSSSLPRPENDRLKRSSSVDAAASNHKALQGAVEPMYSILFVTCYSEGTESITGALNSLASANYPDTHKLIIVVADGIARGKDNAKTTPEIILEMMKVDPSFANPQPMPYLAVADDDYKFNQALVYAGDFMIRTHVSVKRKKPENMSRSFWEDEDALEDEVYEETFAERFIPMLLIVKCGGGIEEQQRSKKPGNRGKRDSQVMILRFLQRVLFDDRMTPLDYDLFNKIYYLTGLTPDVYESIMMVDADTTVAPSSLALMIRALQNDDRIMGLCGETRIANKSMSWVTRIQVFEYYISHHLGKAFESMFGGVTCLPGCFCMYRIKVKRSTGQSWIPLIASPDVLEDYSETTIDTLHKKNLLLLGEDRFLSTLMLRTFPRRKMLFLPQAVCHTIVPDKFSVLVSQRRRWINSTIHNLLELLLVQDLCGIFCCSMQFVIFMELVGTVVLPAAIVFTCILVAYAVSYPETAVGPLVLLLVILGSPAIFIMITTRKWQYVVWMLIYLLALPIWNFFLPLYSYWHFDDFSWGSTRSLQEDDDNDDDDVTKSIPELEGPKKFDPSLVPLKKWADWVKFYHSQKN